MPSQGKHGWLRFAAKAGDKKQYRVWVQVRRFLFFWRDQWPVDNAVRSLEAEFIELCQRLDEILDEHKEAAKYVDQCYQALEQGQLFKGRSTPFQATVPQREALMPDRSDLFKAAKERYTQGQGRQRPGGGGTRTLYLGTDLLKRKDIASLNRESYGQGYDEMIVYKKPEPQQQKSKNRGHNHNQGGQHQNHQNQPNQTQED